MSCDIPPGQPVEAKPHTWIICSRIGCTAAAIVRPIILIWPKDTPFSERTEETACRAQLPLSLCGDCQRKASISLFLTDEGFQRMQAAVAAGQRRQAATTGTALWRPLDRSTARLGYEHILP
jgi:hypothetical protein